MKAIIVGSKASFAWLKPIITSIPEIDEVMRFNASTPAAEYLSHNDVLVCAVEADFYTDDEEQLQDLVKGAPGTAFGLVSDKPALGGAMLALHTGCGFYLTAAEDFSEAVQTVNLAAKSVIDVRRLLKNSCLWQQNQERVLMSFWKDAVHGVFGHGSFEDAKQAASEVGITLHEEDQFILFMFTFGARKTDTHPITPPKTDYHHKFLQQVVEDTLHTDQKSIPIFPISKELYATLLILKAEDDIGEIRTRCNHFMLECEAKLGDHFLCISDQPVGFMDLDASRVQVLRNEITHLQEQNSTFWFTNELVSNINRFVHDNIFQSVTCKSVAEHFYLHPNYLSRYYKASTGTKLSQYILEQKLEAAKERIIEGSDSIGAISEQLGFNNLSYFSKVFKNYYSISPKEYRLIHKSIDN